MTSPRPGLDQCPFQVQDVGEYFSVYILEFSHKSNGDHGFLKDELAYILYLLFQCTTFLSSIVKDEDKIHSMI